MAEIKHRAGMIERVPEPTEVYQKQIAGILEEFMGEVVEEIDALWKAVGDNKRAKAPWDGNKHIRELKNEMKWLTTQLKNIGK